MGKSGGAGGGEKQKRRGEWISSSRLGTYWGVLSEHKGPSPVFIDVGKSLRLSFYWIFSSGYRALSPVLLLCNLFFPQA